MKRSNDNDVVCKVAGNTIPTLVIGCSRHMCGHITDGVSLANGDNAAGYVLSFADLEKAYVAAKAFRENHPISEEEKKFASLLKLRQEGSHTGNE